MTDRRATILLLVAIAAVVVAKIVFKIKVAFLGFKYLLVLVAIVAVVALLTARKRD